ncbi:MAG: hypothetical protein HXM18_05920 [Gemella morbillorum]|uniref:hypothetical protein n=1 Tax=Gemella morbillorum TaxID=29391 RepID=UPI001CB2CD3A|nr:hypothetical protein [Gemella morbillorum]MBF1210057.1 hypothetical protein [Gemella morbillorum]
MLTTKEFIEGLEKLGYRVEFHNNSIMIKEGRSIKNTAFSYWSPFAGVSIDNCACLIYKEVSQDFLNLLTNYLLTPIEERGEFNTSLYRIPLKHLITTDGEQQFLTLKDDTYFACRLKEDLKQVFSEWELNNVPEEYRNLAVEVDND